MRCLLMHTLKPKIRETRWDHKVREAELLRIWEAESLYKSRFTISEGENVIVIDTPPPYASGRWHVGGASHYAQIDMIARYFRLKGYNVIVPFYADRNGLPVEVQVEKTYRINAKEMAKTIEGRREFLKLCKEFLDKAEKEIVGIWRRLGCSFDYWPNGTDSEEYRALTQATFIELYKRGLIYEAERPLRWCPRCGTSLAEAEVEYEDEEGLLYYIKFNIKGSDRSLTVATTRPELLASCAALAYNPKDERYKDLASKIAITPVYSHELIIVEHPAVDPNFGTGLMMICSYGDEEDVRLFNELRLKPRVIIREDGIIKSEAGPLAGLTVSEARAKIKEILESIGALEKVEKIIHKVPKCWRCKTPLQIINRRELFLPQLRFKDDIKRIADMIEFKPETHKKKLFDWIDKLTIDWPISRDRYYGTEIPLWKCTSCGETLLPEEPGRYYRPWEMNPWDKCPKCGAPKEYIVGDHRVFDTWFDSSISPLYVSQWGRNNEFYEKVSSYILRPQGQDIIRTWLYYTLLRVYQLTGRPAFRWVRITGMGLDPSGRPMHKSLGNIIDPEPILEEYGADAFRFWAAVASRLGYDYRYDPGKVKTGRLLLTKLWNIARLISAFPEVEVEEYTLTDKAFMALFEDYIIDVDKAYSDLDTYEPGIKLYELAWDVFASNYIELVKSRAYNRDRLFSIDAQRSAWATLHKIFKGILIAFSPIIPFITDDIYRRLYGKTVHRERMPEPSMTLEDRAKYAGIAKKIIEINKAIWSYKRKLKLRLKDKIENTLILVSKDLEEVLLDLESLHNTKFKTYIEPPKGAESIAPGVYVVKVDYISGSL
ncbi:MAG: valine--tRNA ligase [Acidilobaceae archaeon]